MNNKAVIINLVPDLDLELESSPSLLLLNGVTPKSYQDALSLCHTMRNWIVEAKFDNMAAFTIFITIDPYAYGFAIFFYVLYPQLRIVVVHGGIQIDLSDFVSNIT